jgi:hypothetical protein
MTIKSKNPTVTNVKELGKGAENISAFEAGAIYTISSVETGADDTIAPLIASMFELDIRGADWLAKRGFKTTADMIAAIGEDLAAQHTLEYQERLAWYGKACYKPAEQAIVDAPAPKKTDFETNGEYLEAKETRNNLNSKPAWKMKLLAGRFNTLARQKGEGIVAAKKGADGKKKTALEQLGQQIQNAIAIIQSDKPMPDSVNRDDMAVQLLGFQKVHQLPTTK